MLVDKSELQKTLRLLTAFDTSACPYIGVQFEGDKPQFYRVGGSGLIQSKDYNPQAPATFISLSHITDILKVAQDDKLEMYTDPRGIVRLDSAAHNAHFFVHTVKKEQTGMKVHMFGKPRQVPLDPTMFAGFDTRPFHVQMAGEPLLADGRLMLALKSGVVLWGTSEALKGTQVSPREGFLRLLPGATVEEMFITERGYWGAVTSNLTAYVSGHMANRGLFDEYNVAGTDLATIPAEQLLYALDAASMLCGGTNKVEIDPKVGVIFKDQFGEPSSIGIGKYDTFRPFCIAGQTAKTISDAFSQTSEGEIVLSSMPTTGNPVMRFRRGAFEVNVKTF